MTIEPKRSVRALRELADILHAAEPDDYLVRQFNHVLSMGDPNVSDARRLLDVIVYAAPAPEDA